MKPKPEPIPSVKFKSDLKADHNNDQSKRAIPTRGLSRSKSVVLTPRKKLMTSLLRCYLFFEGCCHNGWNHVNNVYFVVLVGWSPFKVRN